MKRYRFWGAILAINAIVVASAVRWHDIWPDVMVGFCVLVVIQIVIRVVMRFQRRRQAGSLLLVQRSRINGYGIQAPPEG